MRQESQDEIIYMVNSSTEFVNPETACHTNTTENTWRQIKSNLPTYNQQISDFNVYLA